VLLVNRNALAVGHLSNAIGMWPAHVAFAIVGIVLLRRLNRPHAD
jgi:lipopolysaccharide export LptBFGC system permease protein LptF